MVLLDQVIQHHRPPCRRAAFIAAQAVDKALIFGMYPSMACNRLLLTLAAVALASCSSPSNSSTDAGSSNGGGATEGVAGLDLFPKLAGLWSGPASDTRLGDFPLVNMDFRAAGDSVLFGRVDLDSENSLRFAFTVELHSGTRVLVFRNGGLFRGLSRDTRTKLVETNGSSYRFCAIEGGCDYVNATFTFLSETSLEMRVLVRGALHEVWTSTRVEARSLPTPFPARTDLPADADFPMMPTAVIRVRWTSPLSAATDVWAIISTTSCVPSGSCQFSRWIKSRAIAGATDVQIQLDQVHAGPYSVLGVVDVNNNLQSNRFPDSGDLISVPSPTITIAAQETTNGEAFANFTFP